MQSTVLPGVAMWSRWQPERTGSKIAAGALDAPSLGVPVDRILREAMVAGGRVIALEGCKSPGEFALHFGPYGTR